MQALLAAVAAGPGESKGQEDEDNIASWQQNCGHCLELMHQITCLMAITSSVALVQQQLEQLGVWQLVWRLVEATGAPSAAGLMCWRRALKVLLTQPLGVSGAALGAAWCVGRSRHFLSRR